MSDFKSHMRNHFAYCRHIANAYDPYRLRDVKLFHIPGDFTLVGVSDGTDSWIAPIAANPFSVDVIRIYQRIQAGEIIEPPGLVRRRLLVTPQLPAATPPAAAPAPRKRIYDKTSFQR